MRDRGMDLLDVNQGAFERAGIGTPSDVHRGFGSRFFTSWLQVHDCSCGRRWGVECGTSHFIGQVRANEIADVSTRADGDRAVDKIGRSRVAPKPRIVCNPPSVERMRSRV